MAASLAAFERSRPAASNTVFKSGPLFISSKGIGWKSWKKRWFILTRTSLVFFKDDPSLLSQRGGEVNLTLGGIDLDGSGSVVVREDKKLLTVLFPHGQDGRAITFKAGTSEDLFEWKAALEHALARAPNAALVMGQNGILQNETDDTIEGSFHKWADKNPVTSLVVGRPILLALEDVDGGPSFLEKALQFLEKFGTKVEGILRQSADVEEVYHRIQEYEQGKIEFQSNEDANVVGDCVKYVLRELPSSPVPASCCTALLEAYKIDQKEARINAMRSAIIEMLPEPNSRLLHRVLKMMQTISMHAHENRMTPSAVAACMAPLLLRPLLAGECELENEYDMNGDSSAQLLAAANAANHAQAIITTLLEEFDTVFDDGNLQRCSISADSQMENSATEDSSGDESVIVKEDVYHDLEDYVDPEADDGSKLVKSEKMSAFGCDYSDVDSPSHVSVGISTVLTEPQSDKESSIRALKQHGQQKKEIESPGNEVNNPSLLPNTEPYHSIGEILSSMNSGHPLSMPGLKEGSGKTIGKISGSNIHAKRSPLWGRSTDRKTPSMESVDSSSEEELAIQRLEITKTDLHHRIAKEARANATLQASLERRKQALHERHLALEQDVARLQEQLQAERDLRVALEAGLSMTCKHYSGSHVTDSKTRAELEEIALAEADVARLKQKVADLHNQLNQQRQHHHVSLSDAYDHHQVQSHNSLQRYLQHDFNTSVAFRSHERKQRTEVTDHPRHQSAALVELTTRLDFFKERRSQLMEQLHNLDMAYGTASSQEFVYRPSSPPWN